MKGAELLLAQEGATTGGTLITLLPLVLLLLLALIPGTIAHGKGRSFVGWWALGLLLFLPALIAVLLVQPVPDVIEKRQLASGQRRQCPHCAEPVRPAANVCPHCHRDLPATSTDDALLDDLIEAISRRRSSSPSTTRLAKELDRPVPEVAAGLSELAARGSVKGRQPPFGARGETYWTPSK